MHIEIRLEDGQSAEEVTCVTVIDQQGKRQARCWFGVGQRPNGRAYAYLSTLGKQSTGDRYKTAVLAWHDDLERKAGS